MILKLSLLAALVSPQALKSPPEHFKRDIEGWTVQVDSRLFRGENRPVGQRAMRLLATHLDIIKARMRPERVTWLQKNVRIFLDLECGDMKQPVYHPSPEWLRQNGYTTELAKA